MTNKAKIRQQFTEMYKLVSGLRPPVNERKCPDVRPLALCGGCRAPAAHGAESGSECILFVPVSSRWSEAALICCALDLCATVSAIWAYNKDGCRCCSAVCCCEPFCGCFAPLMWARSCTGESDTTRGASSYVQSSTNAVSDANSVTSNSTLVKKTGSFN